MLRQVKWLLVGLFVGVFFLLTAHVRLTDAHESGPPYITVAGEYALGNPILTYALPTTLTLGADIASQSGYMVGDVVDFDIDIRFFPNAYDNDEALSDDHSDADLPEPLFQWDFGDGSAPEVGVHVSHAYTTPGTYIVDLAVQYPEKQTEFASINTVQIDILPPTEYERAQTKIIVDGSSVENPARDVISIRPARPVTFSAQTVGTPPVSYAWDFGNGLGASGSSVTTRYSRDDYFPVVVLRTTDEHGVWTDSYALLELPLVSSNPLTRLWYAIVDFVASLVLR